jgi:Rieske Fe-S protein
MKCPNDDGLLPDGAVVPLDELPGLTRRDFCTKAAQAGFALLALPGCFGSDGGVDHVSTGGFTPDPPGTGTPAGNPGSNPTPGEVDASVPIGSNLDAGVGHPADLSMPSHAVDLVMHQNPTPTASSCTSPPFDTGKAPSSYALNTATYVRTQDLFVCRDANGLYALSSICTHSGCTISFRSTTKTFRCPCHGAQFDFDGNATVRPAYYPLDHYPLCVTGSNTVGIDVNNTTDPADRLAV